MVSTVFLLSLFDTKQPQLLIPVLPAFILFISYLLLRKDFCAEKDHESPFSSMGFPVILIGGILAILPSTSRIEYLPDFLWSISPWAGIGVSVVGITLAWMPVHKMKQQLTNVAIFSLMSTVFIIMWAWWQFGPSYQVEKIVKVLASADARGAPIAHVGDYHGQYGYKARLTHPIKVLGKKDVNAWIANNPKGVLIASTWVFDRKKIPNTPPVFTGEYRNEQVMIWRVADIYQAINNYGAKR